MELNFPIEANVSSPRRSTSRA